MAVATYAAAAINLWSPWPVLHCRVACRTRIPEKARRRPWRWRGSERRSSTSPSRFRVVRAGRPGRLDQAAVAAAGRNGLYVLHHSRGVPRRPVGRQQRWIICGPARLLSRDGVDRLSDSSRGRRSAGRRARWRPLCRTGRWIHGWRWIRSSIFNWIWCAASGRCCPPRCCGAPAFPSPWRPPRSRVRIPGSCPERSMPRTRRVRSPARWHSALC